ncbi:MAG: SUMF1/EgtB/PvdO family nonheme iron enzyme [Deltaproteobacteria bacterium]|nr:SUMF1/EgtB/PvdO family nonheme iron enzyme [Deltaproteobacteria bacterium]
MASSEETQRAAATRNCPARWTWLAGVSNPACWQTFEATWSDVRACADCSVPTAENRLVELSRRAELCTDGEDEPANCLSPGSAERVCRALGLRDFGVGTGRLPTAAEWKNAAQWPDLDAPSLVLARANEGAFNLCDSTFVAAFPSERCVRPTLLDGGARVDPQHPDSWARVAPGGRFPADRVNGLFDVYGNVSEFVSLGSDRWGAGGRSFLSGIAERSGALVVGPQSRNQLAADDFGAQYGFRCIVPLAP